MEHNNDFLKPIVALTLAAIGGLLLGRYLWGTDKGQQVMKENIGFLRKILKRIKDFEDDDALELKNKIQNILKTFEPEHATDK